jgi:hypothetical protein
MREMEEYVRERWLPESIRAYGWVDYHSTSFYQIKIGLGETTIFSGSIEPLSSSPKGWKAAYDFTKEREEEIRQARADVREIEEWASSWPGYLGSGHPISLETTIIMIRAHRTLAREKAHLAELLRGWRK